MITFQEFQRKCKLSREAIAFLKTVPHLDYDQLQLRLLDYQAQYGLISNEPLWVLAILTDRIEVVQRHFKDAIAAIEAQRQCTRSLSLALLVEPPPTESFVSTYCNNSPIHLAAWVGSPVIIAMLVSEFQFPVDQVNDNGDSALLVAAKRQHTDLFFQLLESYGMDPRQSNDQNCHPIHVAAMHNNKAMLSRLVNDYGVSPECITINGETPLYYACRHGHYELARQVLIESMCVNPHVSTHAGQTLVMAAACSGNLQIITYLVNTVKLPVRAVDNENKNALSYAVMHNHTLLAQQLIEQYGLSPFVPGKSKLEPRLIGFAKQYKPMRQLLKIQAKQLYINYLYLIAKQHDQDAGPDELFQDLLIHQSAILDLLLGEMVSESVRIKLLSQAQQCNDDGDPVGALSKLFHHTKRGVPVRAGKSGPCIAQIREELSALGSATECDGQLQQVPGGFAVARI